MRYPNIAAERARLGLSNEELANRLNVTRKTVYNWQKKGSIPQRKLEAMSELFNVSTDYLLSHDESL